MTGEIVMINTIEIIRHFRAVDSNFERFSMKKNILPPSSLPLNKGSYKHLCYNSKIFDGVKLLVGTRVFNGLVTSSARIDKELPPEVEPSTSNSVLERENAGMIKIHIEETACYDTKKIR